MPLADEKLVDVIILAYNSRDDIKECLDSLSSRRFLKDIIVVDNGSNDGTFDFLEKNFKDIRLLKIPENTGYAAGNNAGFRQSSSKYIAVLNPDTVVDQNWLSDLIVPLEKDPHISVVTSKILLYKKNNTINTCSNHSHFTGLDFCRGLDEPSSSFSDTQEVGAVSGCAFAIRREIFEELGGFDPDFFLYLEDIDLSWRARLAGYKIMFVPTSIVYHKFRLSVAPWKEFYLERNRYLMLLKNCSLKMLILISPALIVTEFVTWGHAILHGSPFIYNKLRAYWWVFTNPGKIINKRRRVQKNRKISDREFIRLLEWKIPFEQVIENRILRGMADAVFNSFYSIYFKLIQKII